VYLVRLVGLTLCILGASAFPVTAQTRATTADLGGVVTDQGQLVLVGASVTATNDATNLRRTATTDGDGRFLVPALPPGTYNIVIEASGFVPQTRRDVELALGSFVDLNVSLNVVGVAENVLVVGRAPLVDTQRTVVSSVISRQQIESLPINGRNFISFSVITPGVSDDRTPQQGASATSGLTFVGQRARANNITVDGLDNNDLVAGGVRATFSQEAVQEFQVMASSFSAEFGKASGGIVNIVTKSGTNRHSGDVFGFFRDESLNAKEYFERFNPAGVAIDQEKAPYGQQQFGGTFGGPLRRDRSFYFVSFERLNIDTNNFVTIDDHDVVTVGGRAVGSTADILRRAGFPVEIGHVPYRVNADQLLSKVDHKLGAAQDLSVRFNWAGNFNENIEPWGGLVAKSRGASVDSNDLMAAASHMWVPSSSRIVNELRSQVAYRDQSTLALDPVCSGLCDQEGEGGPTVEVSGGPSVGRQRFTPQLRRNVRFQVLDTFSYYVGAHRYKVGFDYNYIQSSLGTLPLQFGGRYIFAPLPAIPGVLPAPVTAIQALALGLPAAYVQGYGNSGTQYGTQDLSVFGQDDWTLGRDITARLGVRYQKQFWLSSTQYIARGLGTYGFPSDNNNVAPRLSATWDPGHDGRTSVHGAYGMFFENQLTSFIGVSDILNGRSTGVRTLVLRFPADLAAWNAPGRRISEPTTPYPSVVYIPDPNLRTPLAHHTSIGINRELPQQLSLAANFVYVRGRDQVGTLDYNPLVAELGANRRPEDLLNPASGAAIPGSSASVLQPTSFGETWYRGLTVSLSKHLSKAYQFLVSYTLSKAEDTSTDFQSPFIPQNTGKGRDPNNPDGLPIGFDPNQEKGPSLQDQRHRLVVSGLYVLPRDIQVSSIVTVASGRPYNILAGADLDGNGDGGSFPADRARRVPGDSSTSVVRDSGTLPAIATVDLRVSRRFRFSGRSNIEGMFEIFNLFDRTNFTEVNNVFGTAAYPASPLPTYGQFQKAAPPLQVQVAARFTF
jgi:hypothetical protein